MQMMNARRGSLSLIWTERGVKGNQETAKLMSMLPFTINDYIFEKVIGCGCFAVVFKVRHKSYKCYFAAKALPAKANGDANQSLSCEIETMKKLCHPNIIKFYDSFTAYNHVFIILQYCEKGTLKQLMRPGTGMAPTKAKVIMFNILSALMYSHSLMISHRDIKASNVFIDEMSRPLLGDFGFAEVSSAGEKVDGASGAMIYRPPEMILGKPHDPFKGDVWSCGVMFYMMVTGSSPWPTFAMDALKGAIVKGEFVIPDGIDEDIADTIRWMLTPDEAKRPTVAELMETPIFVAMKTVVKPRHSVARVGVSSCLHTRRPNRKGELRFVTGSKSCQSVLKVKTDS